MTKLKTVLFCAHLQFRKWRVSPRIYIIGILLFAFAFGEYRGAAELAKSQGMSVSCWMFPFYLSSATVRGTFGCITVLLFCNAPFEDGHTPFVLIRTGRKVWALGQILYILEASFFYTLLHVVLSVVTAVPHVWFSAGWGSVMKILASGTIQSVNGMPLLYWVDPSILENFTPFTAMLLAFISMWLVSVFFGTMIFCLNLLSGRGAGIFAAGILIFISYFSMVAGMIRYGFILQYFSPLNWASVSGVDWCRTGQFPPPEYAMSLLLAGSILFSVISVIAFCKKDPVFRKGEL